MTPTFCKIATAYLAGRACSAAHEANVRRVASRVQRPDASAVNAFLKKRLAERSSVTVRSDRVMLLSLWRWAYEAGTVEAPPRGIMRIKARRSPTKAWTVEQVRVAFEATDRYKSRRLRSGAPVGLMMRAWLLLAYESGARFGDVWNFSSRQFEGQTLRWQQHKTGDPITKILSPECIEAAQAMLRLSPDGRVLGWCCGSRQAMRRMRAHLDACGLGGSSKWLRRSGATHIEIMHPGQGRHHLGHRSVGLFESAYADWGQIRQNTPSTPRIAAPVN